MKKLPFLILLQAALGSCVLLAQADPYAGYTNTDSYFLPYATEGFAPGNTNDVTISFTLPGSTGLSTNFTMNVDTGSRGVFASSDALGNNFTNAGSFSGLINLSSSGRVYDGYWTPTTMTFSVTNLSTGHLDTITSSVTILDVQKLTCDTAHASTTFGIKDSAASNGTVLLDGGGTANYTNRVLTLSTGQSVSYASNPGLLADVSNFGVGFYLGGVTNSTTTGPIANNQNQIYNPLINLNNTNLAAGYIVKTNGIQLGLANNVSGYAYTKLNPTGLSSTNSVPDWQASMGTVVNGGVTNNPGTVLLDSGISGAYFSASGLASSNDIVSNNITVQLLNSGGAVGGGVGYHIDMSSNSALNPTDISFSTSGTNGIFSQNQSPWGPNYFNTGRNVFDAFNMLYDAQNGYMGLLTNDYGSSLVGNGTVYFSAQAGGFPNPVPEPSAIALFSLSGLVLLAFCRRKQA